MPHTFFAGVDLGATNVRVAIANADGEIEARRAFPYQPAEPEKTLRAISRTVGELARAVWGTASVAAIGMALPGAVDPERGTVASAANLPGWGEVDVAAVLGGEHRMPVAVENDANAAAVGEGWLGAARGLRNHVFVALGTGIGLGLVLDRRLYRGSHALAGEGAFFAMSRDQLHTDGWDANLEGIVGGRAIAARARDLLGEGGKPQDLFDAAPLDERAAAWLAEFHETLAMALVDVIALLDPDAVILGGGVALAQGASLLAPLRALVHRKTPLKTPIMLSTLGADAQIAGAVRLAADALAARAS
jgi:predicted NBD/HSP70 family sugar kinase